MQNLHIIQQLSCKTNNFKTNFCSTFKDVSILSIIFNAVDFMIIISCAKLMIKQKILSN